MKPSRPTLVLASLVPMLLGGCGLRGPLYLPEEKPQVSDGGAQPAASTTIGKADAGVPQPAPQAQKRERATQPAEQSVPQTAK